MKKKNQLKYTTEKNPVLVTELRNGTTNVLNVF